MGYNVGETVVFGNYHGEIEWKVIAKEDGKALLLSKYGIDNKCYEKEYAYATWENCSLRKWLNKSFINESFTAQEREQILCTEVIQNENPVYRVEVGNTTKDRAFLLSIDEVKQYLAPEDLKCTGTDYAKTQGLYVEYNGSNWWWLRTPGYIGYFTSFVHANGEIDPYGYAAIIDRHVVRPAMWVKAE